MVTVALPFRQYMGARTEWSPLSLPKNSNYYVWLPNLGALQAGGAPAIADDDKVDAWTDQLNGITVSQGTDAERPTIQNGVINSKRVFNFDGDDDLLFSASMPFSGSAGSILAIYQLLGAIQDHQDLVTGTANNAQLDFVLAAKAYRNAANPRTIMSQRHASDVADSVQGTSIAVAINTPYAGWWHSSGAAYSMRLNAFNQGIGVIAGANSGDYWADSSNITRLCIGGSEFDVPANWFRGDLAALVIKDGSVFTAAEETLLKAWALKEYAIAA